MFYFIFLIVSFFNLEFSIVKNSYEFHISDDLGYQSNTVIYDVENNEFLRSVKTNSTNAIEVFNFKTGQLKKRFDFNNIHTLSSFYKINDNEFYVYDAFLNSYFKTFNNNAKLIYKEELKPLGAFESYIGEMKFNPLIFIDNKLGMVKSFLRLYSPLKVDDLHKERGMIHFLDLKSNTLNMSVPLPKVLDSIDFGELQRFSVARNKDLLIIAPYYSNEFLIVDLKSDNFIYPIVDKSIDYLVTKPYANMNHVYADNERFFAGMSKHYIENNFYIGILYDSYKNKYYRILINQVGKRKGFSVLVFNSKFQFEKKVDISSDYTYQGMFVSEKGLNILNHAKYRQDNSKLTYDSYVF